jgi:hypothetical protein
MVDWPDFLENLHIRMAEIPDPAPLLDDQSFQQAINDLTSILQDTIRTRIKLKHPTPQFQCWWNSKLDLLRKRLNKLSMISYCFRALEDHPSHREFRQAWNKYGEAIVQAKRKHWADYLEEATANDIWTANRYIKEPAGDGGTHGYPLSRSLVMTVLSEKSTPMMIKLKPSQTPSSPNLHRHPVSLKTSITQIRYQTHCP